MNPDQVIYIVENNTVVLKKMKTDDPNEIYFFSKEYFAEIGFPDAEIGINKLTPDGIMRGGSGYDNLEKLTFLFRQFVFLIQGRQNRKSDVEIPVETNKPGFFSSTKNDTDTDTNKPGFFTRLGTYGHQMSEVVSSGVNKLEQYFAAKKEGHTTINEPVETGQLVVEEETTQKDAKTIEENVPSKNDEYWIVRIPISKNENEIPLGKYEKMEEKVAQMELQRKVDKTAKKDCLNMKMYEVGDRYVGVCLGKDTSVSDNKIEGSELVGSYMSKMSKMSKIRG